MILRLFSHCPTLTLPFLALTYLLALLVLVGCQGYDVTLNDRVVYTPKPLLSDIEVADTALRTCIEDTVNSDLITAEAKLLTLNCANAGIENLDGLAAFSGIQVLRLSNNRVRNLAELGKLTDLTELYLDANIIVDPVPLFRLLKLTYLDLSKNTDLQCPHASSFPQKATVVLPQHCL